MLVSLTHKVCKMLRDKMSYSLGAITTFVAMDLFLFSGSARRTSSLVSA